MNKVYVVFMEYGNPIVKELKEAFSKFPDAQDLADRLGNDTGRTHTVYSCPFNGKLGVVLEYTSED